MSDTSNLIDNEELKGDTESSLADVVVVMSGQPSEPDMDQNTADLDPSSKGIFGTIDPSLDYSSLYPAIMASSIFVRPDPPSSVVIEVLEDD